MTTHHAQAVLVTDVTNYDSTPFHTPDTQCVLLQWSQLGIGEVRELTEKSHRTPTGAREQLLIIKTNFITHEAQNALLKLFEEPPATTRFLLVVPTDWQALPTLRSRLSVVETGGESEQVNEVWNTFVAETYAGRLKEIEARTKAKDVEWQRAIKAGLLATLREGVGVGTGEACAHTNSRLHFVATHLLTRGASNKMLLEELALSWPLK